MRKVHIEAPHPLFLQMDVLAPCVENAVLSPLNCLHISVKNQLTTCCVGLLLDCFVPKSCVSILSLIPHCPDYYSFKSENASTPILLFSFKIVLATVFALNFCVSFRISLLISTKTPALILIGITSTLQISLGRTDILTILIFLIHKHSSFFHLFR